ncbi:MAG: DNA repair protein RecN [Lachnospiraceae bacterium]|nr:DNA repair protein RecN [Lachnospiraceae bacterium]
MLIELHVRNLALIEKADLEFGKGLTILSGETGAGKSILIDSINVALGAKTGKGIIRNGAEYAYIELIFTVDDPAKIRKIKDMDIALEDDGVLIISRKITPVRSIARINDETVTSAKLRSLTGMLIDMHGQFEHQSLLGPASHLDYIDKLSPGEITDIKKNLYGLCREYNEIEAQLNDGSDKIIREREADILRYEIEEISKADLRPGEEEELLEEFRRMKNASKISDGLSSAGNRLDDDGISRALKDVSDIANLDKEIDNIRSGLREIESLIYETRRSIDEYLNSFEYDQERFDQIENRLDVIHRIQGRYGDDIEKILAGLRERQERLEYLNNYDNVHESLMKRKKELTAQITEACDALTEIRKAAAADLKVRITQELNDLNFPGVIFDIEMKKTDKFTANGNDSAQFMISTNPGQPLMPLKDVASGGELSRIMLALKTVLADTDEIETLIFDEIDAGISGKTAQKVAGKLHIIGKNHQVLCITHLPQIAAKADNHFLISKSTDGMKTRTDIRLIEGEESVAEIARMMGSEITENVLAAAREMKG